MKLIGKIGLTVALPLLLGTVIYCCFREGNLLLFNWVNALGGESLLETIHLDWNLPGWIKYNLPDALWLYALISTMVLIWRKQLRGAQKHLLLLLPLIAFGMELAQLHTSIVGTFDPWDLSFYGFAALLGLAPIYLNRTKQDLELSTV